MDDTGNLDVILGARLKERRNHLKMSQKALAEMVDMSFQQIQKYETGASRLSVSMLMLMADALRTTPESLIKDIKPQQSVSAPSAHIQTTRREPLQLLIAEDNIGDALLVREAVSQADFPAELQVLQDGAAVLPYLNDCHKRADLPTPDVILLDFNLPKQTGPEVLAQIRKHSIYRLIPVLGITSTLRRHELTAFYEAGGSGFLSKAVPPDQFQSAITTMVNYWAGTVVLPAMA